ncbi:MAG: SDR family NAD(P)-dependent oxidoreductase [Longimicrobiales bacterium]
MGYEEYRGRTRTTVTSAAGWILGIALLGGLLALGAARAAGEPAPSGDTEEAAQQAGDRVILVTGSTSGLGREVALRLAEEGAHIIVHGRNEERGREVVRQIEEETPGSAAFYRADLASNAEINELADRILEDYDRLDVLLNNAGIYLNPEGRVLSQDGYELRFHVNYLSHFLLTERLLPLLRESAPSRIVNVASGAQTPIDFDDVMLEEGYSESRAYAQSKLAQVLHTFELEERLEGTGITVNTLHPATLMDTPMVEEAGTQPRSTVDEGAEAVLQLVNDDVGSGRYFNGLNPTRAHDQAYDEEARDRLWELSEELTGLD